MGVRSCLVIWASEVAWLHVSDTRFPTAWLYLVHWCISHNRCYIMSLLQYVVARFYALTTNNSEEEIHRFYVEMAISQTGFQKVGIVIGAFRDIFCSL